jgi:metallophosphoesterase (TIGR03767 family)
VGISRRNLLATAGLAGAAAAADPLGILRGDGAPAGAATAPAAFTSWDVTVQRASYIPAAGYQQVVNGLGEPHLVRTELWSTLGHATLPLGAFVQMTDLHIVDDQSPARLEFMDAYADPPFDKPYPTGSAYRPHEFLSTQVVDAMCQAIRGIGKGPRTGLPLQFTIVTGDAIDNCQHNESRWYIDLLDGGQTIVPDSGQLGRDQSFSAGVTGGHTSPTYYYPSVPAAQVPTNQFTGSGAGAHGFPVIPGLLSTDGVGAARRPFVSTGLGMPWYAAYGNHDGMWQGNLPIDSFFYDSTGLAVGSLKTSGTAEFLPLNYDDLGTWGKLMAAFSQVGDPVVADPNRRLLTRKAFIQDHFNTAGLPVGHGFSTVGTNLAYYAIPSGTNDLIQYITLDTTNNNTDGFGDGDASGSIDEDQWQWLWRQLLSNSSRYLNGLGQIQTQNGVKDKLMVIFCHHTLLTMTNPNKDVLGRTPHFGYELKNMLLMFPNVIALVDGHTHANKITPYARSASAAIRGGFWEISTASHIDWPIQSRIIEIAASPELQNTGEFGGSPGPGTISIFTTMVDPAAPLTYDGDLSTPAQLASLARELATNDPQEVRGGIRSRMGFTTDRNTQLLLAAPFPLHAPHPLGTPIAVERNLDGRLELFGTDLAGNVWNTHQGTVSGNLAAWTKLETGPGWQSVAASTNQDGRVEVFALNGGGTVRFRSQTAVNAATYNQAGVGLDSFFTAVTATRDQWGGIHLFAALSNGAIYHRWQDNPNDDNRTTGWFTPWTQFGGTATQLAAATGQDGRGVVVWITEEGALVHRKMNVPNAQTPSEWGGFLPLDGRLSSVALTKHADGRLVIFGLNSDGQVLHRSETASGNGTWSAWSGVVVQPGVHLRHIAAALNGAGRIELFAVADDGLLYHHKQSNPNSGNWGTTWGALNIHLRATQTFVGL